MASKYGFTKPQDVADERRRWEVAAFASFWTAWLRLSGAIEDVLQDLCQANRTPWRAWPLHRSMSTQDYVVSREGADRFVRSRYQYGWHIRAASSTVFNLDFAVEQASPGVVLQLTTAPKLMPDGERAHLVTVLNRISGGLLVPLRSPAIDRNLSIVPLGARFKRGSWDCNGEASTELSVSTTQATQYRQFTTAWSRWSGTIESYLREICLRKGQAYAVAPLNCTEWYFVKDAQGVERLTKTQYQCGWCLTYQRSPESREGVLAVRVLARRGQARDNEALVMQVYRQGLAWYRAGHEPHFVGDEYDEIVTRLRRASSLKTLEEERWHFGHVDNSFFGVEFLISCPVDARLTRQEWDVIVE